MRKPILCVTQNFDRVFGTLDISISRYGPTTTLQTQIPFLSSQDQRKKVFIIECVCEIMEKSFFFFKPSCDTRFERTFTACVLKVITLV